MKLKDLGRPHILLTNYKLERKGYRGNTPLNYVSFHLQNQAYRFREAVHSAQPLILHNTCRRLGGAMCIVVRRSSRKFLIHDKEHHVPERQDIILVGDPVVVKKEKLPGYTKLPEPSIERGLTIIGDGSFFNDEATSMKFYLRGPKVRLLKETLISILTCKGFWVENYNLLFKTTDEVRKRFEELKKA